MAWQEEFRKYQVTIPKDYMIGSDQPHPQAGQTIDVTQGSPEWNKFINTGLVKEVNTVPQTSYNTIKDIATSGAGYSNLQVLPDSAGNYAARYTDPSGQQHQSDLQGFLTSRNISLSSMPGQGPTSATGTSAVAKANLAAEQAVTNLNKPQGLNIASVSGVQNQQPQQVTPNFIKGLTVPQQQSIINLMKNRPSSQWSATDIKNWNYATGGQALPSGYPAGTPSDKITADSFNKPTQINVPNVQPLDLTTANGMVQGANTELQNIINSLTVTQTPTEQKQKTLLDSMASLVGEQSNKAADQLTAEQSSGLPQLRQQFADINAKILSKMAEYKVLTADQEGKPVTMQSIIGSQAQAQRVAAADIGLLQAQAQGLQGQISTAQETVNRAIDLKYSTIDSKLNIYQAQLNALQPTLNKEEKIQAQAQQILLQQQQQALADKKAEEKNKANFILELASKYPDANISLNDSQEVAQSKIKNSKIYQQATRLVGGGTSGGAGTSTTTGNGQNVTLTDYDILAGSIGARMSVAAKKTFDSQYSKANTDADRLKILAANVNLPAEQKNGIIQNAQVVRSIDDVMKLIDSGTKTGLLQAGQSYIANKLGTGGDKQVETIKSKLVAAIQPYRNKVTGAAWGDQEEAEYQALIGSVKFTPEDLMNKLNVFKNTLQAQSQTALMASIDPLGAINQTSVLENQPALQTTPITTVVTPPAQQGFWSGVKNWLWGDN